MNETFFQLEKHEAVAWLWLARPRKYNMMNPQFWTELPQQLQSLNQDKEIKVIVLAGQGKNFSAGLDIDEFLHHYPWLLEEQKSAEQNEMLFDLIEQMQNAINTIQKIDIPVIAATHGHCIGGGLDLISACDIRLATKEASFSLREVKVHIVADMGSLQRLPAIIGEGYTRELAFTGKDIKAKEALSIGLVTHVYSTKDELFEQAQNLAKQISQNNRLVMKGIKHTLNYGQNHSLQSSLDYIKTYNSSFLLSHDFLKMARALHERKQKKDNYSKPKNKSKE